MPLPRLDLREIEHGPEDDRTDILRLATSAGTLLGRWHPSPGEAAVLWVFGSGGGLGGPAGGAWSRLGARLQEDGIASLELDYRRPGELGACRQDALLALDWMGSLGKARVAVVGHSFGGAVAIGAGLLSDRVVAVAALSSQVEGTADVRALAPKPLLLIHGAADEVLPDLGSRDIHDRAGAPRELILYPGCRHGLDGCREALDRDLMAWLGRVLPP